MNHLLQQLQSEPLTQLRELVQTIDKQQPDPAALQTLRDFLTDQPDLWQTIGDLAGHAAVALLNGVKERPLFTESLKHNLATLRTDLDYAAAAPLERLLIEQVVLCWLRLNLAELTYSQQLNQPLTPVAVDHWDKRLAAAQRRFLQACQTLARIRKLTRTTPALQLNIAADGSQQINLIGRL